MPTIKVTAPAKVNLTFRILGLRQDGYHNVETLLQSIDLQDELEISVERAAQSSVSLTVVNHGVAKSFPLDGSNLVSSAATKFLEAINKPARIGVAIEKNIPIGAGLAGGSSDAAATLVALNSLHDNVLSASQLHQLARTLGADVPFCIEGGTQIGTDRGDVLHRTECDTTFSLCIVKPRGLSILTPQAFADFDEYTGKLPMPSVQRAAKALADGDIESCLTEFGNDFEPVIFQRHPELAQLKQQLLALGCRSCHLTGSGPALIATVADSEQAHFVRKKFFKNEDDGFDYDSAAHSAEFGPPFEFYIAQSIPYGARVLTYAN